MRFVLNPLAPNGLASEGSNNSTSVVMQNGVSRSLVDGKVAGASSSTDNAVARFDGATGKTVQNSGVTIDDSNNLTVPGTMSATTGLSHGGFSTVSIFGVPIVSVKNTSVATGTDIQLVPTSLASAFYGISNPVLAFGSPTVGPDTYLHRDGVNILKTPGIMRAADAVDSGDLVTKAQHDTKKTSYAIDVRDYDAVADCRTVTDANMTSGSTTLTSATANFTADDVGKIITVGLAGVGKIPLTTTITARTNSTTVTLASGNASGANVVNRPAGIGTDNTTAFTNAITAARAAGKTVYVPTGSYAINGTILNDTSKYPDGFNILGDGKNSTKIYMFNDTTTTPPFFINSTANGVTTLSVAASKGDQTITVASTTNMKVGDYLQIKDNDQPILGFDNTQQAIIGEFAKIQKIDSATQVTLTGQLNFNFGNTDTDVVICNMCTGISFEGINFVNPIPECQVGGTNIATFVYCNDIEVKDCAITEYENNGWSLQGCVNARILNVTVRNTNLMTTPYPILLRSGTQDVLIDQCVMIRGRHLVTTAQTTTSASAKFVVVSNCMAWQCTNSPFDIHPGASHFKFINCNVYMANIDPPLSPVDGGITNGLGDAFQIRGPDCQIINCNVYGAFRGITMHNGSHRTRILGCHLENCDIGIYTINSDDIRIEDTQIVNPRTNGFEIDPTSSGWAVTKLYMKNVRVDGNPSGAAFKFDKWGNDFYIDPSVTAPDATTKMSGRAATTVASAATLTLPPWVNVVQVTGTTNISAMTVTQQDHNRRVTLRFAGILTISSGTGLSLRGNITTAAGSTLDLMCDGTSWYEVDSVGAANTVSLTGAQVLTNKTLSGFTMTDATDVVLNTATGTKIGTATTQKLGFFNATPVVQQAAATDLGTSLANLGLRASGNYQLATAGAATLTGAVRFGIQTSATDTAMAATATPYQFVNAASNNVTMTLPTAVGVSGRWFHFKRTDNSANTVTIATSASQTIDGASTYTGLSAQYKHVKVVSDGSNWLVFGSN